MKRFLVSAFCLCLSARALALDTDGDGIPDGIESGLAVLLWEHDGDPGALDLGLEGAEQVAACAGFRAARTSGGRVVIYGSGGARLADEECGATELAAFGGRVAALTTNGVLACWWTNRFGVVRQELPAVGAHSLSAGLNHFLLMLPDGRTGSFKFTGTNALAKTTSAFTNTADAVACSAGSKWDAVLRSDGSCRVGDSTAAGYSTRSFPAGGLDSAAYVAAGSNGHWAAVSPDGAVASILSTTVRSLTPAGASGVFGAGFRTLLAAYPDGTAYTSTYAKPVWTNATGAVGLPAGWRGVWYADNCGAAVGPDWRIR
ncbi:MAG: hypothetical protein IJU44_12520, partial [Kiritimatiellae bacterium]|nr:hypothetical protein [Kiritimatiellia bacterium]